MKLQYDGPLSNFAFKFNLRRYNEVRVKGDSCGGVVTCIVRNCPRGLGAPVFDKLEADLAKVGRCRLKPV